jgi:hypothetical protein
MSRFINERKDNWQRLEDLLSLVRGASLRGLSKMEVREFGELYRRAASDLAIARAETRDPEIDKLSQQSGHSRARQNLSRRIRAQISSGSFSRAIFRRLFAATWRYTALAFGFYFVQRCIIFALLQ